MKKIFAFCLSVAVILLSSSTVATGYAETSVEPISVNDYQHKGSYLKDVTTGKVTFIPSSSVNTLSRDTEGFSPEYNPYNETELALPSPRVVFGNDDRLPIRQPHLYGQYRNTVYISVTTSSGTTYRGTGFMIGPNTVATNGHIVYNSDYEGDNWPTSATITPALGENEYAPYGTATAIAYECGGNWFSSGDPNDDWGIIRLNRNIGDQTGWLGIHWQSESYSSTKDVDLNGYPSVVNNEPTKLMHVSFGHIDISEARMLKSDDLDASGGNSGGPCFYHDATHGYVAIGILQGGSNNESYTTVLRIDQWLFNKLTSYTALRA